jgi:predicted HTH transcriptional regulator
LLLPIQECATGRVSLAALLLFGKEAALSRHLPHCETVVNLPGKHLVLRKNIVDSLRELVLTDRSPLRTACPAIPEVTFRELVVNAYIHRCWRTNGPVVITATDQALDIQNPGDLLSGLTVDTLLYAVPLYRNFSLAEGVRFAGLADKIGQGIDIVFRTVLSGGFDFPTFESANNAFRATVPMSRSDEFREFVRRRGASLSQLDELVVLRYLWAASDAPFDQLCVALQRGKEITNRVLRSMQSKNMIETGGSGYQLTPNLRMDIERVFRADQLNLDLFGAA